jgi:hypothetical protein
MRCFRLHTFCVRLAAPHSTHRPMSQPRQRSRHRGANNVRQRLDARWRATTLIEFPLMLTRAPPATNPEFCQTVTLLPLTRHQICAYTTEYTLAPTNLAPTPVIAPDLAKLRDMVFPEESVHFLLLRCVTFPGSPVQ